MRRVTIGVGCLAVTLSTGIAAQSPRIDPNVRAIVDQVSPERLQTIIETLASFRTRHTMSVSDSTHWGITPAREWIRDQFQSYSSKLQVSFDCYDIPAQGRISAEVTLCNVMAVLPGRSARRIYVSGHYDTVARRIESGQFDYGRWDNLAPGANDDGSGTAITMELARVISQGDAMFDATLVFLAIAGEEEGLVGARLHAQQARSDSIRIDAVLNNDIIGNAVGGNGIYDSRTLRVFSEDPMDSPSRQLARYVKRIGELYVPSHTVRLIAREDRFGRGGDHTAFNRQGYAGVRFSESRENYARQHTVDDTPDGVSAPYLAQNARVNAAVMASLGIAPPAPEIYRGSNPRLGRGGGYDAALQWDRSSGATGYKIVWRTAWTPDWEHELHVGNVTEFTLRDMSIDDYVFGVLAVGPGGNESLVSAYIRPPRQDAPVLRNR